MSVLVVVDSRSCSFLIRCDGMVWYGSNSFCEDVSLMGPEAPISGVVNIPGEEIGTAHTAPGKKGCWAPGVERGPHKAPGGEKWRKAPDKERDTAWRRVEIDGARRG
eukprot:6201511-Pleurochrysis_carterae.AAC.1